MVLRPAAGMIRPLGVPSGAWLPAIWSKAAVNCRSEVKAVPSPNHSAVLNGESSSEEGGVPFGFPGSLSAKPCPAPRARGDRVSVIALTLHLSPAPRFRLR